MYLFVRDVIGIGFWFLDASAGRTIPSSVQKVKVLMFFLLDQKEQKNQDENKLAVPAQTIFSSGHPCEEKAGVCPAINVAFLGNYA